MKRQKRIYGLLPVIGANHHYQVGKVPLEERLANLMLEDLRDDTEKRIQTVVKKW